MSIIRFVFDMRIRAYFQQLSRGLCIPARVQGRRKLTENYFGIFENLHWGRETKQHLPIELSPLSIIRSNVKAYYTEIQGTRQWSCICTNNNVVTNLHRVMLGTSSHILCGSRIKSKSRIILLSSYISVRGFNLPGFLVYLWFCSTFVSGRYILE